MFRRDRTGIGAVGDLETEFGCCGGIGRALSPAPDERESHVSASPRPHYRETADEMGAGPARGAGRDEGDGGDEGRYTFGMAKTKEIRVGPTGSSCADWSGVVYPARRPRGGHALDFISQWFNTVEINVSFYWPVPEELLRWYPSQSATIGAGAA